MHHSLVNTLVCEVVTLIKLVYVLTRPLFLGGNAGGRNRLMEVLQGLNSNSPPSSW